jgi:hypothetical protein
MTSDHDTFSEIYLSALNTLLGLIATERHPLEAASS